MTALAALKAFPTEDREPRARIAKDSGSFHDEIEHAKREPAKKADKPKEKRPRGDEPEATTAEAPVVKTIAVKREVADIALAVKFSPAPKVGGDELEAMIQQSAAVATQQVARAATDTAVLPPMTPLEQAVHDLIDQLRDRNDEPEPGPGAATAEVAPVAPLVFAPVEDRDVAAPVPVAPIREADTELAQPLNPSHVHLVIDEAERLVVTVAVRGDNVIAHVRGGDDATAAGLARNAATLDTAMRARGLQLTDFQASRDGSSDTPQDKPQRERQRDQTKQPKFTLEKTP
jgi:hypothetical protein